MLLKITVYLGILIYFFSFVTYCKAEQNVRNQAKILTDQALGTNDNNKKKLLYKEATRIDPSYERAHSNLAHVLFRIQEYGDAAIHFAKALTPPDYIENHYNTALSLFKTGKPDLLNSALFHLYEYLDSYTTSNQNGSIFQEAVLLKKQIEEELNKKQRYTANKHFSVKDIQEALVGNHINKERGESRFSGGRQALSISFPYKIDNLSLENKNKLDVICFALKKTKIDHDIIILGYALYREGSDRETRSELAHQRAAIVKSYLEKTCNIPSEQLHIETADSAINYHPIGNTEIYVEFIDKSTGNKLIKPR